MAGGFVDSEYPTLFFKLVIVLPFCSAYLFLASPSSLALRAFSTHSPPDLF